MRSLKQQIPPGIKGSEGKCLIQVQRVTGKWEENTPKKQAWRSGRRQLTSGIAQRKSIKYWLGCLVLPLTLEERLEMTSKHVLFGEHNVVKQF